MSFHPATSADHVPPRRHDNPEVFGHVALAVGGDSAEREVSLDGGKSVGAAMARLGIDFEIYDGGAAVTFTAWPEL